MLFFFFFFFFFFFNQLHHLVPSWVEPLCHAGSNHKRTPLHISGAYVALRPLPPAKDVFQCRPVFAPCSFPTTSGLRGDYVMSRPCNLSLFFQWDGAGIPLPLLAWRSG